MTQVKSPEQMAREEAARQWPRVPESMTLALMDLYLTGHRSRDTEVEQLREGAAGLRAALEECSERTDNSETYRLIQKALAADYGREVMVETERLRSDLDKAVAFLKEGKAKFAPSTTNSFVDDFISDYDRKREILAANTGKAGEE